MNRNILKVIINIIISFILSCLMLSSALILVLKFTVFDKNFLNNVLIKYDMEKVVENYILENYKKELRSTGLNDEFIASLVDTDTIAGHIGLAYNEVYGDGGMLAPALNLYKENMRQKFDGEIEKLGVEYSDDIKKAVDTVCDKLYKIYEGAVKFPYASRISIYIAGFGQVISICTIVIPALSILFVVYLIYINANRYYGVRYLTVSSLSVMLSLGVPLAAYFTFGLFNGESMQNPITGSLIRAVTDEIALAILYAVIFFAVASAFLAAVSVITGNKIKKDD